MSRRLSPETLSIRDQIAATLRDAVEPMTAWDVAELLPCTTERVPCREQIAAESAHFVRGHDYWTDDHHSVVAVECAGAEDILSKRQWGPEVSKLVSLLERDGLVRRVGKAFRGRLLWVWSGPAPDEIDALEAMFGGDEMADLRRVFESEPSVPATVARAASRPLDEVSTVDELLAEMTRQGIAAAWAPDMEHAAVYLPHERIMVLNRQCDAIELRDAVTELLEDRRP